MSFFSYESESMSSVFSTAPATETSLLEVHKNLLKCMTPAVKMCGSLNDQVAFFLDQAVNFPSWYLNIFEPAIQAHEGRIQKMKSLERAMKQKNIAKEYSELEKSNEKAFEYVNMAIKNAPSDEANFLANCFSLRSEFHLNHRNDLNTSLLDIEKALQYRAHSYSCIRRKLDLLDSMKRPEDAFLFLERILAEPYIHKLSNEKREKLKAKKRALREYAQVMTTDQENEMTEDKPKETEPWVSIDSRVWMKQNEHHKRYEFFANELIPASQELLKERPALFILKSDGRSLYCSSCWRSCVNSFSPCPGCTEVVYCSEKCAHENEAEHGAECGLIGLLQGETNNVHAIQVFRFLVQHGHEQLTKLDQENIDFKLDEYFNSIASGSVLPSSAQILQGFAHFQSNLLHGYYSSKPDRTANEMSTGIFLLALYLHRKGIPPISFSGEQLRDLVRILATLLYAATINEYAWTDRYAKSKNLAAFQCLFGSRVGHSCETNADWYFDKGHFTLRSTKAIEPGSQICISFGVNAKDTPDMYVRQATVSRFQRMCSCARCMKDATKNFCLACENCGGPVPWNEQSLPQDNQCLVCEAKYERIDAAKIVYKGMQSTQRAIWLTSTLDKEDYLAVIESKMSALACYVYLRNEQFASMVRDLCEQYILRSSYREAVGWYQWLAHGNGLYLDVTAPETEGNDLDQQLVRFNYLDQWVHCYLAFVEGAGHSLSSTDVYDHLIVCDNLLVKLNAITTNWANLLPSQTLVELGQNQQAVGKLLSDLVIGKSARYTTLARDVISNVLTHVETHVDQQDGDHHLGQEPNTASLDIDLVGPDELEIYSIGPEDDVKEEQLPLRFN